MAEAHTTGHGAVLWLPRIAAGIAFRPQAQLVNGMPLLEWYCRRFARANPRLPLHVVTRRNGAESDQVASLRHLGVEPIVIDLAPKWEERLGVASTLGLTTVAGLSLPHVFAPDDLLGRMLESHAASAAECTLVRGLPPGTTPEIYSALLLRRLATRGPTAATLGEELDRGAEGHVRVNWWLGERAYACEAAVLPARIVMESQDDLEIARQVIETAPPSTPPSYYVRWAEISTRVATARREHLRLAARTEAPIARRKVSDKIRALYVSPSLAFSGAEHMLSRLITQVRNCGVVPHLVTIFDGTLASRVRALGVPVTVTGRDFTVADVDNGLYWLSVLRTLQPDIIHLEGVPGVPLLTAAEQLGVPMVQHVRVATGQPFRQSFKSAAAIIVVSHYVRRALMNEGVSGDKIHTVYDGVEMSTMGIDVATRRAHKAKLHLDPDCPTVLYVARFEPRKRHDRVLRAIARLRDTMPHVRLLCVGEVMSSMVGYYRDVRCLIDRLQLNDCVREIGFTEDIQSVELAADVVVMCSDREPFAGCVLECMALGVPAVLTGTGGLAEVVTHGDNGFVVDDADDSVALARALEEAIRGGPSVQAMLTRARELIAETLSVRAYVRHIAAVYQSIPAVLDSRFI